MGVSYKTQDNNSACFITMTIVEWINVFTIEKQKLLIIDSLKYCQENKGLEIYGWCLMPNHLQMICRVTGNLEMSEFLRDFKKYTSKAIVKSIIEEPKKSQEWMLVQFKDACSHLKRNQKYKLWQNDNHAEIIYTNDFFTKNLITYITIQ